MEHLTISRGDTRRPARRRKTFGRCQGNSNAPEHLGFNQSVPAPIKISANLKETLLRFVICFTYRPIGIHIKKHGPQEAASDMEQGSRAKLKG
jgi:hypothetical protein